MAEVLVSRTKGILLRRPGEEDWAPKRIIGHPEIADEGIFKVGNILYISLRKAIEYQIGQCAAAGQKVYVHIHPTKGDRQATAIFRLALLFRWMKDEAPDGWAGSRSGWCDSIVK